jgi:hypothetical protein
MGRFVDGTFGLPFAALDHRVDPAGDAADGAANVTAHAEPVARELVRLRRDLGTATPLEDGRSTPLVQVVRYSAGPAGSAQVERALAELHRSTSPGSLLPYTVYQTLAGSEGVDPGFLVLVWRDGWSSFADPAESPVEALRLGLGGAMGSGPSVEGVRTTSWIWRFRPDLTYLPDGGGR